MGRARASAASLRATRGTYTRARRPRSGRIVARMVGNKTTGATSPATHVSYGIDATAPRSDRGGRRYRGSRVLVALAPATHGYFLRPLRGRFSTAERSMSAFGDVPESCRLVAISIVPGIKPSAIHCVEFRRATSVNRCTSGILPARRAARRTGTPGSWSAGPRRVVRRSIESFRSSHSSR